MDLETESECEASEEIQEVDSAEQIDQLNALRCKMQSGKFNLSRTKSDEISRNGMPCMRKGMPKEETYDKYGEADRRVGIGDIENVGHSR